MAIILDSIKHFDVLDVNISAVNLETACLAVDELIRENKKGYVCVCPVSTVLECQSNELMRQIVNEASLATPDGMPIAWLGQLGGYRDVRRVYGPDLMLAICQMGQARGYKHYFYGGTEETCRLLEVRLKERFPGLKVAGRFSPPFRELTPEELKKIVEEINRCQPDILWVGLGSPKQDFWMYENRGILTIPVMIGVGAAFDFLSGTKGQAPRWMQRIALEWLFRLCSEPKRLWRRYLIGNPKFIYLLIKDYFMRISGNK
jgi:N-acetylglucosaminyldiphosphoundecaprenol N-acetyl-beta-D-mannosaminyltransferase